MKATNHVISYDQVESYRLEVSKKEEEKRRLERIQNTLKNVPPVFLGKTFSDFHINYSEQEKIKHIAMRYVDFFSERNKDGTGLIFLGKPGTGKTFLSLIIYQDLVENGISVKYESSLQFLRLFRDKNFESSSAFETLLASYRQYQLLIIDECTESRVSGNLLAAWEKEMLFALIYARYQHCLSTIVISNRSKNKFIAQLGERIAGRLLERNIALGFNWNSYRRL